MRIATPNKGFQEKKTHRHKYVGGKNLLIYVGAIGEKEKRHRKIGFRYE